MDIRRQRTRALLVQAFEELSRTKALQEISVSEICELATVRRGTYTSMRTLLCEARAPS